MKRSVKMLALVAVVAVLAIGYLIISNLNKEEYVPPVEETTQMLVELDAGNITAISYTNQGKDTIELEYGANTGKWYLSRDRKFPVEQSIPGYMATVISSIPLKRVVEKTSENKATYGLDKPILTVTAVYGSDSYTYMLGDLNSFSGDYYFMVKGDDAIYSVPAGINDYFAYDLLDIAVVDTIPEMSGDSITIKSAESSYLGSEKSPLPVDKTEAIIALISDIELGAPIDYSFGEADDEKYGFIDNTLTVSITYTVTEAVTNSDNSISSNVHIDKNFGITITTSAADTVYCMVNDSKLIYEINSKLAFDIVDAAI